MDVYNIFLTSCFKNVRPNNMLQVEKQCLSQNYLFKQNQKPPLKPFELKKKKKNCLGTMWVFICLWCFQRNVNVFRGCFWFC